MLSTYLPPAPYSAPNPLDNPIWSALTTSHASLALGGALARRYPPEIGPLSGLADQSDAAWDELHAIAAPTGPIVLFLPEPYTPRPGWTSLREGPLSQFLCTAPADPELEPLRAGTALRPLTAADAPEMLALATLTEPGPFATRTHELGGFYGIFEQGRLLSMAGQRTRTPGYVEVSAVCTHPDARGRGFARTLMLRVMADIRAEGSTPYLHTWAFNHNAIRVYEALGFELRHSMNVAALRADSA